MPKPVERLALLLSLHGESYRDAGARCGVDHTTIRRVALGETENPATLAQIAEGYGVPLLWMQGRPDLVTDFAMTVLTRSLQERISFLWNPGRRLGFAMAFLRRYDPSRYGTSQLALLTQLSEQEISKIIADEHGQVPPAAMPALIAQTGIPAQWFSTGLIGWEDEEEVLVGLAEWAVTSLAKSVGIAITEQEIHEVALALV